MKNKTILLSSIALAVFLLVVGTGLVTNAFAKNQATDTASKTPDLSMFMQREEQYQKLINEANQKIALANQQISSLVANTAEPIPESSSTILFSAEQAAQIAANIVGAEPKKTPELVNFNGILAYEVEFETNRYEGKIYIDANTGAVLYNGIQQAAEYITTEQAVTIATNYIGGGTVTQVGFGLFDGDQVYIVQFSNGQSVYIDLQGKVEAVQMAPSTSTYNDSDDDHGDEPEHEVEND